MNDDLYLETLEVKYLSEGLDDEEMEWIFKQAKRNQSLEKWSKKQTERVQELEESLERWQAGRNVAISTKRKVDKIEQQNERYREALEFYENE